jgi:hypothetical protein
MLYQVSYKKKHKNRFYWLTDEQISILKQDIASVKKHSKKVRYSLFFYNISPVKSDTYFTEHKHTSTAGTFILDVKLGQKRMFLTRSNINV